MSRPYIILDENFLNFDEEVLKNISSTKPLNIEKMVINFFSDMENLLEIEFSKKTKKIQLISEFEEIPEKENIVLGDKIVSLKQEFNVSISQCDEITFPTTPINTTPNPTPYIPVPKTYVYTGVNPVTKIIEGWVTTVINSKSPTEALPYYLHVTLME